MVLGFTPEPGQYPPLFSMLLVDGLVLRLAGIITCGKGFSWSAAGDNLVCFSFF